MDALIHSNQPSHSTQHADPSRIYQRISFDFLNANRPHLFGQLLPDTFVPFPKNPHIAQLLDTDTLNERQKHILQLIQQDEKITNNLIAKTLNISVETSKRDLAKLTKMNMIQHCGSRKTGHWEINTSFKHKQ